MMATFKKSLIRGKRFLMVKPPAAQQGGMDQITVVLNWFEELRRRVPAGK
jgi:hypothetical protein